jgi:chromosome segregation ATPase
MSSTKLENRIVLCSVTFIVSCFLSIVLLDRNVKKMLAIGAIASSASFIGATIIDRKAIEQERLKRSVLKQRANLLQKEIFYLEKDREQLRKSLLTTTTVRQEIEHSVNHLDSEKNELVARVQELNREKEEIEAVIASLAPQKKQLEKDCQQKQIDLKELSDRQTELDRIVREQLAKIQQDEACLSLLREEYQQLQDHISEIYSQKETFDDNVHQLENQKQQLLASVNDLEWHICQLQAQKQSLIEYEEMAENNNDDGNQLSSEWNELLDSI